MLIALESTDMSKGLSQLRRDAEAEPLMSLEGLWQEVRQQSVLWTVSWSLCHMEAVSSSKDKLLTDSTGDVVGGTGHSMYRQCQSLLIATWNANMLNVPRKGVAGP